MWSSSPQLHSWSKYLISNLINIIAHDSCLYLTASENSSKCLLLWMLGRYTVFGQSMYFWAFSFCGINVTLSSCLIVSFVLIFVGDIETFLCVTLIIFPDSLFYKTLSDSFFQLRRQKWKLNSVFLLSLCLRLGTFLKERFSNLCIIMTWHFST